MSNFYQNILNVNLAQLAHKPLKSIKITYLCIEACQNFRSKMPILLFIDMVLNEAKNNFECFVILIKSK